MDEPGWLTFYTAAQEVKLREGGSQAEAQAKLRLACAEEKIRSMKAPYDDENQLPFEFWTRIAPNEWWDRQVDYDGLDADGCKMMAMLNEDDFRHWLGQPPLKTKGPSKRDLVKQVIDEIWPDGIPETILNKQIEQQVGDRLKPLDISRDTILRAAGRKAD